MIGWIIGGIITGLIAFWVMNIIRLRKSIPRYDRYWKQRMAEPGDFVYVALGDSAAQAIGTRHPERGYVGRLAERIEAKTSRSVRVVNLSQTGAPTDDVMHRQLAELAHYMPDLVTLAIGGNDIRRFEAPKFERNIRTIIEGLPEGTFVADAPYFMHGEWEEHAIEMSKITRRVAEAHGMVVVPLYIAMKAEGWKAMFDSYAADWFHPNTRGYSVWFDVFWKEIEPTLEAPKTQKRGTVK